jgi:hypothetical protein
VVEYFGVLARQKGSSAIPWLTALNLNNLYLSFEVIEIVAYRLLVCIDDTDITRIVSGLGQYVVIGVSSMHTIVQYHRH